MPDLARPSGGCTYDEQVVRAWPQDAPELVPARVACRDGLPIAGHELDRLLRRHDVTIVDGLIGSVQPKVIERAEKEGYAVVLLVHMPRPADPALTEAERSRLAELEAAAVQAARRVIVPSRWAASDLRNRYGRTDLVVGIPGAPVAPPAGTHHPPVLLQLGAVGPLKNQLLTVHAARACHDLDFRLRLVGPVVDDAYAAKITEAIADFGSRARLEPAVHGQARDTVLADADLVVSVAVRETYGLTVTEGLARGIPALVGRGTGAQEALAAGGAPAGTAVATQDPAELADILRAFLTDPDLRRRWRTKALTARSRLPTWADTAGILARACASAQHELGTSAQDELGTDVLTEQETP